MCGIAGFYVRNREGIDLEKLADELLLGIEHRGQDATGYFAASADGVVAELKKDDIPATWFVQTRNFLPPNLKMFLGHTRLATKGKPDQMENNHPVNYQSCFVTHNGVIYNDDAIVEETGHMRAAEVDSIAIPHLVTHCGFDKALETLPKVQGSWALAIADPITAPNELLLVRGSSSPLIVLDHPKIIVWASTQKAIEEAWQIAVGTAPSVSKYDWLQEGEAVVVNAEGESEVVTFMEKPVYQSSFRNNKQWNGWTSADEDEFVRGPARVTNYQPPKDKPMCFQCGEKQAFFHVTDSMAEGERTVEWDVPVCYDCKKLVEEDEYGVQILTYRFADKDAKVGLRYKKELGNCELCQNGPATGYNAFGAVLCDRCLSSEPKLVASFTGGEEEGMYLRLNPGDCIPMKIRKNFVGCEACGKKMVAFISEEGFAICGMCHMQEQFPEGDAETKVRNATLCASCDVYYDESAMTMTLFGMLCSDCKKIVTMDEVVDDDPDACGVEVVKRDPESPSRFARLFGHRAGSDA